MKFHLRQALIIIRLIHHILCMFSELFVFVYGAWVELSPLLLQALIGLLYQPRMIDGDDYGAAAGMRDRQGKP
jgi:4-hydroxybenzoate polyprenyltransferase